MNFVQIGENNCIVHDIKNNDIVPIGGTFPWNFDLKVLVDIDSFDDFFKEVADKVKQLQSTQAFGTWFKSTEIDMNVNLFLHLFALNSMIRKKYPNSSENLKNRADFYNPDIPKKLSDAFANGICACAEYSLLAVGYLQTVGIKSEYIGGGFSNGNDHELHSYVKIKDKFKEYIFDVANPHKIENILYPRISTSGISLSQKKDFEAKIKSERPNAFVETVDVIKKSKLYYGFNDGNDFYELYSPEPENKAQFKNQIQDNSDNYHGK